MTPSPVQLLLEQLELSQLDDHTFDASTATYDEAQRFPMLFGGLIAAQALRAAQLGVRSEQRVHSLHGYFLATGEPGKNVRLDVDPVRDGRSFSTRRVVARQGDEAIFTMLTSFHRCEPGTDFQAPSATVAIPEPTGRPHSFAHFPPARVFDIREVDGPAPDDPGAMPTTRRFWARTVEPLPDDPAIHECVLTYLSDLGVLPAMASAIGADLRRGAVGASLDHTVHIQRHLRMDDWVLLDRTPVSATGSRGLIHATMHTAAGTLGATTTQECLIRA